MTDRRTNRVFKLERKDIRFPLWRKKVDGSIFNERMISIPNAFAEFWNIAKQFQGVLKKTDPRSKVPIFFDGVEYQGNITGHKTRKNLYRISYNTDLTNKLKDTFTMTFMRDLEFKIGADLYTSDDDRRNIEDVVPFWEFLDIEYDDVQNAIYFTCHYKQTPHFSNLFKKLVDSTVLRGIELELENNHEKRIVSGKWFTKSELRNHLDVTNVIYYLLDDVSKQIYVGEAISLKSRLSGKRPEIPEWTHFRYDVLPPLLEPFRVEIELMLISAFMNLCQCDSFRGLPMLISDYKLMNKKYIKK